MALCGLQSLSYLYMCLRRLIIYDNVIIEVNKQVHCKFCPHLKEAAVCH